MDYPFFHVSHYIDGQFVDRGPRFDILYPATNHVIGSAPEAGAAEVDAAVQAAARAFRQWSRTPVAERRLILKRFAQLIRDHEAELAAIETWDVGRPISENRAGYIPRIAANIEFFADFAATHGSEAYPMDNGYINYVLRQPVGVAALIAPWNIPLLQATWKMGPALAFGNTVVMKPAELTPIGTWRLAQLAHEAGVPPGVINVIHGFGPNSAGEFLTKHPDVKLISFTGETTTGKIIMAAASSTLKRVSFELGGKGANLIFADADLDRAVAISLRSSFFNQGEFCLAGPRLLVQRPIYDAFLERFRAAAANLTVGDPFAASTKVGALISREHHERVSSYIAIARDSGARIIQGGTQPNLPSPFDQGNFLQPTIIVDVQPRDRVCQEEIFGPVVTVAPFDDEEEAIAIANGVGYGLSAVVQTRDVGRAVRLGAALEAGTIWINDFFVRDLRVPFGGMKNSGIGREGGHYSLEFYTEAKTICLSNQ
ncbi:5-carboxymethyl-2-hydroxymuconate semialdehyde dehydrogenase [Chloroflexus islandicus]|uniref:5-carboxymethyl-2-hydroxymuconate semialdehyde dehydrogenase n=1 Tax=Chloroflexus islandicus TaxID=1707952 RepID=A0A178MGZ7_9CHLR|nr:aldehyde dehydrogenase [Chloroflexus islandicus]OAN47274.1 5-carboxymethyl-2-hydroxymuconate semialdehyde dehydrogenase [Chloroflexus islandicus]